MSLSIVTLGTASQAPTKSRALNSVVVRFEKGLTLISNISSVLERISMKYIQTKNSLDPKLQFK